MPHMIKTGHRIWDKRICNDTDAIIKDKPENNRIASVEVTNLVTVSIDHNSIC